MSVFSESDSEFDVVVVGAGSSGSVVASRLSEEDSLKVLLLEAGADFPDERFKPWPWMTMGHGIGGLTSGPPVPEMDWNLWSEPLSNGRRLPLKRGKVVGGSSMVNGCVAVRARPEDFDRWTELGAKGWSWSDVLPYFEIVEKAVGLRQHSRDAWLPVQQLHVRGYEEMGYRWYDDINGPDAWDGAVGPWTHNLINGMRGGTLVNYVRWARHRPNFGIRDRVTVDKLIMDGKRAVGVEYLDADGHTVTVRAQRVVLSAGVFATSPILMRSGIGPADELRALNIEPIVDLPVGKRVLDHGNCHFRMKTPREYARIGTPALAAVIRGDDFFAIPTPCDEEAGICSLIYGTTNLDGNGTVQLVSSDPTIAPRIDLKFQEIIDGNLFDGAWNSFNELLQTNALREVGARSAEVGQSLKEILEERMNSTAHGAGGCAIGAVVAPDLSVYDTSSLFVADSSVFPMNVTNNTHLTCLVVGERAAEYVRSSFA